MNIFISSETGKLKFRCKTINVGAQKKTINVDEKNYKAYIVLSQILLSESTAYE